MEFSAELRVTMAETVLAQRVGDEMVLLDMSDEMYLGLNDTAALMWEQLAAGKTAGEAVAAVLAEYDVDEATVQADLVALVEDLLSRKLVSAAA